MSDSISKLPRALRAARVAGLGLALLIGCDRSPPDQTGAPAGSAEKAAEPAVSHHGAPFAGAQAVSLAKVLADPEKHEGQAVLTSGKVERACSRKGCWMELSDGEASCRVTFKDYGFFVPTDSAGALAKVEGSLVIKRVPAGRVRHLEQEGAQFASKKADGSALEARLVATSVELRR